MARYRARWRKVVWACVDLVWRPHIFSILVFEVRTVISIECRVLKTSIQAMIFGFTTGINVSASASACIFA